MCVYIYILLSKYSLKSVNNIVINISDSLYYVFKPVMISSNNKVYVTSFKRY